MGYFLYQSLIDMWTHEIYKINRRYPNFASGCKYMCSKKCCELIWVYFVYFTSNPVYKKNKEPSVYSKITLNYRTHHHHHHRVMPLAWISLALSRHFSLSFIASGRSSGLHPVSSHSCWMYVGAGRPAFARPYVGVHRSTSLMRSSLLLQQCPACLVRLTWIVFVTGGRIVGALWGVAARTCSILLSIFLCDCRLWKSNLTDKMKRSFFQAAVVSILLYGCTTWTQTKRLEKKKIGLIVYSKILISAKY